MFLENKDPIPAPFLLPWFPGLPLHHAHPYFPYWHRQWALSELPVGPSLLVGYPPSRLCAWLSSPSPTSSPRAAGHSLNLAPHLFTSLPWKAPLTCGLGIPQFCAAPTLQFWVLVVPCVNLSGFSNLSTLLDGHVRAWAPQGWASHSTLTVRMAPSHPNRC